MSGGRSVTPVELGGIEGLKRPGGCGYRNALGGRLTNWDRPDFYGCGCSSGVEHDLAKVGVEGSNPFARSNLALFSPRTPRLAHSICGTALNLISGTALNLPLRLRSPSRQSYFPLRKEPLPVFCVGLSRLPTCSISKRGGFAMWLTLFAVVAALAIGFALGALFVEEAEEKAPS